MRIGGACAGWCVGSCLTTQAAAQTPAAAAKPPAPAQADTAGDGALPARVPWRGTMLRWTHHVIEAQEECVMSWALPLSYYVFDMDAWDLRASLVPSLSVEVTNSDSTQCRTGVSDLAGQPRRGDHLTTSPRLLVRNELVFVNAEPRLTGFLDIGFRWDHRFGAETPPVNEDLDRPRQTSSGDTFYPDQLTRSQHPTDKLRETITLWLVGEHAGWSVNLFGGFRFAQAFKGDYEESECSVVIETGCVDADPNIDARTSFNSLGFLAGLEVSPTAELAVALEYVNMTGQLGPDGERRDLFNNPDAVFALSLALGIDALYERAAGAPRDYWYHRAH